MRKSEYLESLFESFNSGKISEEAFDAGVQNINLFCEEDKDFNEEE